MGYPKLQVPDCVSVQAILIPFSERHLVTRCKLFQRNSSPRYHLLNAASGDWGPL